MYIAFKRHLGVFWGVSRGPNRQPTVPKSAFKDSPPRSPPVISQQRQKIVYKMIGRTKNYHFYEYEYEMIKNL